MLLANKVEQEIVKQIARHTAKMPSDNMLIIANAMGRKGNTMPAAPLRVSCLTGCGQPAHEPLTQKFFIPELATSELNASGFITHVFSDSELISARPPFLDRPANTIFINNIAFAAIIRISKSLIFGLLLAGGYFVVVHFLYDVVIGS